MVSHGWSWLVNTLAGIVLRINIIEAKILAGGKNE